MEIYLYEDLLYRFICFIYRYIWIFIILCIWIYMEIVYVYKNDQIYVHPIIHNIALIMKAKINSGPVRWEVMLVVLTISLGQIFHLSRLSYLIIKTSICDAVECWYVHVVSKHFTFSHHNNLWDFTVIIFIVK